jgi:hypothetical protein
MLASFAVAICMIACSHPPETTGQTAAGYDSAIQQAVGTLSAYATQTGQKANGTFSITTYNLKGLTMLDAVTKIEPGLTGAGFKQYGKTPGSSILVFSAPNKGGVVTLTDPDPVKAPELFQMTTMRRTELAREAAGR